MKSEVFNQDCMEGMRELPDNFADLACVDPPYGIGEDGSKTHGRTFRKDGTHRLSIDNRTGRKSLIYNKYRSAGWDHKQPDQEYFNELFRVSKKVIIWGANYINFDQKDTSSGLIFWDKVNGTNDFSDGEVAWTDLFSSVRKFEFMWNGMLQGKGAVSGKINQGDKSLCETRIHPTQKPVQLYGWIYKNYLPEGGKVLDTHGGSFSNRIAADKAGNIDFIGYEIDKEYYDKAERRYKDFKSQLRMF